jgi:hypothetical protein
MTHVNDLRLLVVQDLVFSYSSIIVFLLNLMFSITYYLHLTTIICILHFFNLMCSQIIFKRCLKNCVDSFLFSLQKRVVYDLNPTCNSNNPNLTIVFFHGIAFGTNDEWKETKNSAYVGQKSGYRKTWTRMFEFYHCPMILTLWQVFTMMWLKLAKTSFKVWLQIQGVIISSIYGHINYFSLCTLKIIVYILIIV